MLAESNEATNKYNILIDEKKILQERN